MDDNKDVKCAKDLIGKLALRVVPVPTSEGTFDYSFVSGQPVKIVNVTDWHVYIEGLYSSNMVHALDKRFMQGWVEWCPRPISTEAIDGNEVIS